MVFHDVHEGSFYDGIMQQNHQDIIGDPDHDMQSWHEQTYDDTCAVVSQEFVLEELTGQHFSEDQLRVEAMENGWYAPGEGTSLDNMGNLLEAHGINVEKGFDNNLGDIAIKLDEGEKVIVGVDGDEIWTHGEDGRVDELNSFWGVEDKDANHAVEVIGIDNSSPDAPMVILNDPGTPDGMGMEVPADEFMHAWEDSDHYMVSTNSSGEMERGDLAEEGDLFDVISGHEGNDISFKGYYNADGTYHWSSDNTNTDSHGNVVYYG